jgi:CheY-specific phosphatase CheX
MNPGDQRPDLRRIGERAFVEVLDVILSLPATVQNLPRQQVLPQSPYQISSAVTFAGQQLSGIVRLHFPLAFVEHAFRILTGLNGPAPGCDDLLEDAAGELANMIAGRVAAQLAAAGYPCNLGTPSVSRGAGPATKPEPGADQARVELICVGHLLSLEIQCRYPVA